MRDADETDPRLADTDGDGLSDPFEWTRGTSPTAPDTDLDGLLDGDEDQNRNGRVDEGETDPLNRDTDGGGEGDGHELQFGRDPLMPNDDSVELDTDGDGLPDEEEDRNQDGILDDDETDPANRFRCNGLSDLHERLYATNPQRGHGRRWHHRGNEDQNRNGRHDLGESDPRQVDTDDDGLPDGLEDQIRMAVTTRADAD